MPVTAARSSAAANRIEPSSVFSATFPVKPSVTITSSSPASRSPPSTLPAKLSGSAPCGGSLASSSCARLVNLFPFPGSVPIVSSPTWGAGTPSAVCAYATPSWPNWTSISGLGSAVAPASMSTVRPGRVGSTTASPGRSTPGSDRSRSRAVATMPPVDPADTTAAASPRRTSWHATATLDRGRRRLASAPSFIARLSSAGTTWTSSMAPSPPSTWRSRAAGPVSRTRTPCSRWAASAPATISPGA